MREGRTTIGAWELAMLRAVVDGSDRDDRAEALRQYLFERDRRKRYARTRDGRDRTRRTLVGTHISRDVAERIRTIAELEGTSLNAFVKRALRQAIERSDTWRGR